MKRFYLLSFIVILTCVSAEAQVFRYTVKLKYKRSDSYSLSAPSAFLSPKAISKRIKFRIPIDSTDLPLNPAYVDSIAGIEGITILSKSKWLNQLLIEADDVNAILAINEFPFIVTTKPVAAIPRMRRNVPNTAALNYSQELPLATDRVRRVLADTLDYGNNYPQIHLHEGEFLHNKGFQGQGITIAILDAGFLSYKSNPAFDSVRINNQIAGEYDFVKQETSVDEDNVHGANCFSIMAANRPGFIVGTAPKSTYWLFRTEDAGSEKPVEEYNWIAGAECADSAGADMISSSLGYVNFDDPTYNHPYAERDGNTALITLAADLAVKKGMIVMNSAGNSGNSGDDTKYIMCPADGDSVVTVGAVNTSGVIGGFSSWGPNAAGRVKPNIVSVGWNAVYANTLGNPATGNGTSYSNPNIAGLIACLWQAFPDFRNTEIIDAVQRSADRFLSPDDRYGYGIPNFREAYAILETKQQERTNSILNGTWIKAFPVPFRQYFNLFVKAPSTGNAIIRVYDVTGTTVMQKTVQVTQGSHYTVPVNISAVKRYSMYYVEYNDGNNKTTVKLISL